MATTLCDGERKTDTACNETGKIYGFVGVWSQSNVEVIAQIEALA
jgi:hypothetical protein